MQYTNDTKSKAQAILCLIRFIELAKNPKDKYVRKPQK